jgi:hypothetical protein
MVKTRQLVLEYLEDLSGEILDQTSVVENFVAKRPGIYALYQHGSLYYVGLATNLRTRLKHHQKDRHQGKWDRFSVYITSSDEHLKDLESLLLRVTKKPHGNRQNGKFQAATNRNSALKQIFKTHQNKKLNEVFNILDKTSEKGKLSSTPSTRTGPFALRGYHKGQIIKALLKKNAAVKIGSREFSSLSAAASHVTGHPTNGRWFWHIKVDGDWVRLKISEGG